MTPAQARKRHEELTEEIRRHDNAYYVLAQPSIPDREYDRLFQELLDLEKEFTELITPESPSQRVGGAPVGGFTRVEHPMPMLSLEKIKASSHPDKDEEPDVERRKQMQDRNTIEEFRSFDSGIRKQTGRERVEYVVEPKVDGVSISVHYRHGKLVLGATRGDGRTGDDITVNIKTIRAIPLELKTKNPPALLEVRGEAYIAIKDFVEMNRKLEEAGEEPFPNARNATAGTLKQLDPRLVAQRPIRAVFYSIGALEGIEFATHAEELESLKRFGLPTQAEWWICNGPEETFDCYFKKVVTDYDETRDLRTRVPYEVDGIVIKVNRLADQEKIPFKSRAPGYAIVHKPVPWVERVETVLREITIQVGRTGILTPVAELEPVFVQGSTISRATLHNEDEIERKDIRIGDTVVIRKAGMVIPEIVEVVKTRRRGDSRKFDFLAHIGGKCPACGGPITREEVASGTKKEVAWRCMNVAGCPAQKTRRIEYFAQRRALDIESLGGIVAEKLVERDLVDEPLELFNLKVETLGQLNLGTLEQPRVFGEKNAAKVVAALERAKTMPLNRWIYALAIANVGEATAYQLAQVHDSIEELADSANLRDIRQLGQIEGERALNSPHSKKNRPATPEEKETRKKRNDELQEEIAKLEERLEKIGRREKMPEVGPVVAASVLDFFASATGKKVLRRLKELDIHPVSIKTTARQSAAGNDSFSGKTFVLTGTLSEMSRDEAAAEIRQRGGTVTGSVSKNTDYLVHGEDAGSKMEKARALGIEMLNEKEFLARLKRGSGTRGKSGDELL